MRKLAAVAVGLLVLGTLVWLVLVRPGKASAADLTSLRKATPALLQADAAVGRLPDGGPSRRVPAVRKAVDDGTIARRVDAVWAQAQEASKTQEWVTALRKAARDTGYESYTSNSFHVTSWGKVTAWGPRARVQLVGHPTYVDDSGSVSDEDSTYTVTLRRQSTAAAPYGGWQLESVSFDSGSSG